MSSERDELIYHYVHGDASPEQRARLQALLSAEPALMRQIFVAAQTERDLRMLFSKEAPAQERVLRSLLARSPTSQHNVKIHRTKRRGSISRRGRALEQSWSWIMPTAAACCVLAVLLFVGGPERSKSTAPQTRPPAVVRSTQEQQQAREALASLEKQQQQMQQRLAQIEQARQLLTEKAPLSISDPQGFRAAQEQNELERRRVEAELESVRAQHAQLRQQLEPTQPEQPATPELTQRAPLPVEGTELGRVTFAAPGGPEAALLRGSGPTAVRLPLQEGTILLRGDRIDIAKSEQPAHEARLAVRLWCGEVDLADDTLLEFVDLENIRLEHGQLFAELNLKQNHTRPETRDLYRMVFKTAQAEATVEGTRFELAADPNFTRLRVEEGQIRFSNNKGAVQVKAQQESVARAAKLPSSPQPVQPLALWRGRRGAEKTHSLWGSADPAASFFDGKQAHELGLKFRSEIDGYVAGIRFFKSSTDKGTHAGRLWSSEGVLLATANFTAETEAGWQQVAFDKPVLIKANTTYIASYYSSTGLMAFTYRYFEKTAFSNPPLQTLANGAEGPNGVYALGPGGGFPKRSAIIGTNYWVDVLFVPRPKP